MRSTPALFLSVSALLVSTADLMGEPPETTPVWAQSYYSESINEWSDKSRPNRLGDLYAALIIDTWAVNAAQLGILEDGRKFLSLLESAKPLVAPGHAIHISILKDGEVNKANI